MTRGVELARLGWRRPIRARAVEDHRTSYLRGREPLTHLLEDPEDLARLLRCEACYACLTPFPAPPGPDTAHLFRGLEYGEPEDVTLEFVRRRRCPMAFCHVELRPELAEKFLVGDRWNMPDERTANATLDRVLKTLPR